jgi:serine phosphatase RsbU (regulator of sigma subunit)
VTLVVGVLRSTAERRPGRLLAVLNRALAGQTGGGFVTCCCARFEPDGRVTLANAGHLPPLADGRELELPGLPLGVVPDVDYAEVLLEAREFVFLSDGVIEAENAQRELFGFQRTREISAKSAAAIAATAKAWGQNDDITVVTVRRTA